MTTRSRLRGPLAAIVASVAVDATPKVASMKIDNIGEFVRGPEKADTTPATRDDSDGGHASGGGPVQRSASTRRAP